MAPTKRALLLALLFGWLAGSPATAWSPRLLVGEIDFATPPGFTVVRSTRDEVDMELRKPNVPWYQLSVTCRELGDVSSLSRPELRQIVAGLRKSLRKSGPIKLKPILVQGYMGYLLDYSGLSGHSRLHAHQVLWVREGFLTVVSCMCVEGKPMPSKAGPSDVLGRAHHFVLSLVKGSHWANERG